MTVTEKSATKGANEHRVAMVIDIGAKMPVCRHYTGSSYETSAKEGGLDERGECVWLVLSQIKVSNPSKVSKPPCRFLWFCLLVWLFEIVTLIKQMSFYLFVRRVHLGPYAPLLGCDKITFEPLHCFTGDHHCKKTYFRMESLASFELALEFV